MRRQLVQYGIESPSFPFKKFNNIELAVIEACRMTAFEAMFLSLQARQQFFNMLQG